MGTQENLRAWHVGRASERNALRVAQGIPRNARVLVCGGRDFNERAGLFFILDALHKAFGIRSVLSGMARGADTLAVQWANHAQLPVEEFRADWDKWGKSAGILRNKAMLDTKPDYVVAFDGGTGTFHCTSEAMLRNITVLHYKKGVLDNG